MGAFKSELLTEKEKNEIFSLNFSKHKLVKNFTLTLEELSHIKQMMRSHIKLGYALQLLFIKNLGRSMPSSSSAIPLSIIDYISEQLEIKNKNIERYFSSDITKRRNYQEICSKLGFLKFTANSKIINLTTEVASKNSSNKEMVLEFLLKLKEFKIIAPGFSTIEDLLITAIRKSNADIYDAILTQIPDKTKLDSLLIADDKGISPFSHIKNIEINSTTKGLKTLLKHIKYINSFNCPCNLDFLSPEKLRFFF